MTGSYSKEELFNVLGEPIGTETFANFPGGTTGVAFVFACTCRGMPNGGHYVILSPCLAHGGLEGVIRISDRRCGPATLIDLSNGAMELLAELIRRQDGAESDARGCTDITFEHDALRKYGRQLTELIEARLLVQRPKNRLALAFFTCFDVGTGEWY